MDGYKCRWLWKYAASMGLVRRDNIEDEDQVQDDRRGPDSFYLEFQHVHRYINAYPGPISGHLFK